MSNLIVLENLVKLRELTKLQEKIDEIKKKQRKKK